MPACGETGFGKNGRKNPSPIAKAIAPPTFLHGLHSSASKALSGSGRFQGCAYPVHQLCYPNPRPSAAELAATPKDLLFSFAGRASHRVRRQLFAHNFNRRRCARRRHFQLLPLCRPDRKSSCARPAALLGNGQSFKICAVPARSRHIHHAHF